MIMIVKVERPGHPPELLTYWSPRAWTAQLFYNTKRDHAGVIDKCKISVEEVFRIPGDRVHVDESAGRPLVVHKRSQDPVESKLGILEYQWRIQPLVIDGLPWALMKDGHAVGRDGYDYSLMPIAALKTDKRAMDVNGAEINFVGTEFGGNTLRFIPSSTFEEPG